MRTDRIYPLDLRAELSRERLPKYIEVKRLTREQHEAVGSRVGLFLVPYNPHDTRFRRPSGHYRLALNMYKAGMLLREIAVVFNVSNSRASQMVRKGEKRGWASG